MDIMNEIKNSLDNNPELTDAVKGNIYELVLIFHETFTKVKLDKFKDKLTTLQIVRLSKFVNPNVSMYDFRKNIIYLNSSEIAKGYDMKHVLMFEIINMISATDNFTGFNFDDKYKALNLGYTEILANFLVGNESDISMYTYEAANANLISTILGPETMFQAYFTNNVDLLISKIVEMGVML